MVMRLYQVVAKDALRRRRRVFYTALGVAFGVAVVVALLTVSDAGEEKIAAELDKYGPNLMVTPATENLELQLGDLSLGTLAMGDTYIDDAKLPTVRKIADDAIRESLNIEDEGNIAIVAPKLYAKSRINETTVTVVGIDLEQESLLNSWWMVSNGVYPGGPNEALLGDRAASALDMQPGDTFQIEGREITVSGILDETGANADYQVFIPLQTAQEVFSKEGLVSSVDIRALCLGCPVEVIAAAINQNIAGVRAVAVKQIAESEMNVINKVQDFMLAIAGITLVLGMFGVVNTMMSSVHERTKDIGIMKAVGASPYQIVRLFLYEALIVGVLGGMIGFGAGTALSYAVGPVIFEGAKISYVPEYIGPALGVAVMVALVSSAYPAFRASRIKVAESIRSM
ncbi:MAG: ABC transporter permease [Chloroflexi bacterium]|nr:ABC transporter permease [Chloroflexota bacterium]